MEYTIVLVSHEFDFGDGLGFKNATLLLDWYGNTLHAAQKRKRPLFIWTIPICGWHVASIYGDKKALW